MHHANVEIRTAYLDKVVIGILDSTIHSNETRIDDKSTRKLFRLIIMGGGYDTRGVKLLERSLLHSPIADDSSRPLHKLLLLDERHRFNRWRWWHNTSSRRRRKSNGFQGKGAGTLSGNDRLPPLLGAQLKAVANARCDLECYELDLPEVVQAKRRLLTRLHRRRPWLRDAEAGVEKNSFPKLVEANFNSMDETRKALEGILLPPPSLANGIMDCDYDIVTNIFIFEGVMIYLDDGVPHALLRLCSETLETTSLVSMASSEGYLCFADRLENIHGGDSDAARAEMESTGWELIDWLAKPGLARHMGVARRVS